MNGKKTRVSKFASSLRQSLFSEHFGMDNEEVSDPLNPEFITKIQSIAKTNTEAYREVFACYPDDNIKKYSEFKAFGEKENLELYPEKSQQIQGFAVEFPLKFLENDTMGSAFTHFVKKEFYAPTDMFV